MSNLTIPFTLQPPPFVSGALVRLLDAGYQAYIVGGALRDSLLHRRILDWDIATSAQSDQVMKLFTDAKNYCLKHKTVTLVFPDNRVEITPFRGTEKTLEGDLAGRDFTINAMAYDVFQKTLTDPRGGQEDLAQRMIRATGNPDSRFREDPIRILRGIRLAAQLDFRIHQRTMDAMNTGAFLLSVVAAERIRNELMKLLKCPVPSKGFRIMADHDLLKEIIPELAQGVYVEQNDYHRYTVFDHIMEAVDIVSPVSHLRLAALFHDIAKPLVRTYENGEWRFLGHEKKSASLAVKIMERLKCSRLLIERVTRLVRHHMIGYSSAWGNPAIRRFIARVGKENVMDLLLLRKADILAHGMGAHQLGPLNELEMRILSIMRENVATGVQDLAINGYDVMKALDLPSGPLVGNILNGLLDLVTDNPHLNNPNNLMALLKKDLPLCT